MVLLWYSVYCTEAVVFVLVWSFRGVLRYVLQSRKTCTISKTILLFVLQIKFFILLRTYTVKRR
jgi:hypothetical protein